ncbi:alpha-xylosidase 1-like [Dorcoceras hygrometricum]|uniref:Alpha-xylosidase 1-like n=1 Tax=Dorcoceras hygrometricum TaxID=472368 RepID=A0A2Z7CET4_9LAMI|nr:alpha-xylosidase 1-like [Dorcoceras hygrometricum]
MLTNTCRPLTRTRYTTRSLYAKPDLSSERVIDPAANTSVAQCDTCLRHTLALPDLSIQRSPATVPLTSVDVWKSQNASASLPRHSRPSRPHQTTPYHLILAAKHANTQGTRFLSKSNQFDPNSQPDFTR